MTGQSAPVAGFAESDRPPILALDTSSAQGGVALYNGQRLSLRSWPADRSHTRTALGEIHHVLDAEGLAPDGLAAIAVAVGPGAFTGLRVGIGIGKGFHLATAVPLIGISTLEATALPFAFCGLPIVSVITVGRGRSVWAYYLPGGPGVVETRPPRNGTALDLVEELRAAESVVVAGELDDEQVARITEATRATVPPRTIRLRQAAAVAEVGWRRWLAGSVDDAATLEPVYLSR